MRRRVIVGVTGAPGAGKSTVASRLVAALGDDAVLVPMDGFHRYQPELEELGRADRKGAPDTFDVSAYCATLARVRSDDGPVAVPDFDRAAEDPVPDAIAVEPGHRVVVTEGNYLLVDRGGWEAVRPLLDACWYVEGDEALRVERLVARHVEFGRTPEAAWKWVERSDEANARLIAATRGRADVVVGPHVDVDELVGEVARLLADADQTR